MKILVTAKRVIDYNVRIRIKDDGSDIETQNVKMSMNPFDEIAMEAAVRLKEAGIAKEILVVSCGSQPCQDVLRSGLAMGADRALLVETSAELQPLTVAKLLKEIVVREQADMVMMGKQAIDDDFNQTGQMLAALLNWPQGTFVSHLVIEGDMIQVTREVDGGLETVRLKLPAVITVDLRLNQPRYITLPNIMKAKQKPLTVLTPEQLAVDTHPHLKQLKISPPLPRKAGIKVNSVKELLEKLMQEEKISLFSGMHTHKD